MEYNYDVIVAGSGPAGGQAARDIAARDYDILVLEAEKEEVFPNRSKKSTAGTFSETLEDFGIPEDVLQNSTDRVVLESPENCFEMDKPGAVMEFGDYKRWMVEDAQNKGADYRFGARVNGPIYDDTGEITGVKYNGDETVEGDIIIDATGPAAPLASELGVSDLPRDREAIGVEYEMEGVEMERDGFATLEDSMMLRLGHDWAPGGYSWIFHTGEDTAKVGVCYLQSEAHRDYGQEDATIEDYMDKMIDDDPRLEDAEKIKGERHVGSAHIKMPENLSTDNFMAIGDTVPSIDPLWGEGIDKCMRSGRAAATTVDEALKGERDTSADVMSKYDDLWQNDVAHDQNRRLAMTELIYMASNERYDKLMGQLDNLDPDSLDHLNNGKMITLAKVFKTQDFSLLKRFGSMRLRRNDKVNKVQDLWAKAEEKVENWDLER